MDGQEITPEKFSDTFISIPLTAGSHTLEFSYTPAGMQLGILLSGISLVIFLALIAFHLWKKNNDRKILPSANAYTEKEEEDRLNQELELISRLTSSEPPSEKQKTSESSQKEEDLFDETPLDDSSKSTTKEDIKQ